MPKLAQVLVTGICTCTTCYLMLVVITNIEMVIGISTSRIDKYPSYKVRITLAAQGREMVEFYCKG